MRFGRAVLFAAIVLALLGVRCGQGFREDEMECEEAMSDLGRCCNGFDARQASCTYASGCNDFAANPVFTVGESQCIRGESCAQLNSTGVCTRAKHLPYVPEWSSTPQPVCP